VAEACSSLKFIIYFVTGFFFLFIFAILRTKLCSVPSVNMNFLSVVTMRFLRIKVHNSTYPWVRGTVVGSGTMLKAGRSPVRVSHEVDFFNLPNPSSLTMALVSTQPLTKMSTRNILGGKKRPNV
jgi:hypothetical protein